MRAEPASAYKSCFCSPTATNNMLVICTQFSKKGQWFPRISGWCCGTGILWRSRGDTRRYLAKWALANDCEITRRGSKRRLGRFGHIVVSPNKNNIMEKWAYTWEKCGIRAYVLSCLGRSDDVSCVIGWHCMYAVLKRFPASKCKFGRIFTGFFHRLQMWWWSFSGVRELIEAQSSRGANADHRSVQMHHLWVSETYLGRHLRCNPWVYR